MFGKLLEMQQQMEALKKRLDTLSTEASDAEGRIRVRINGNRRITDVFLDPAVCQHTDSEELAERLQVVLNRAIEQADQLNESEMRGIAGSMLPGLMG